MIGREVIKTNRPFTLDELEIFMEENWDKEEYNPFLRGRPTAVSVEEFIMLPATERFMIIVLSRKKSFFNKTDKVILSVCENSEGIFDKLYSGAQTHNIFVGIERMQVNRSLEDERKHGAQKALIKYAEYMKTLLDRAGYTL